MARKTRAELEVEEAVQLAELMKWNSNDLPRIVLHALAEADKLGLDYFVHYVGDTNAIEVGITAREGHDLPYTAEAAVTVYFPPSKHGYTTQWQVEQLGELNKYVIEYRTELKRQADVKKAALDKLNDEELRVLGLKR